MNKKSEAIFGILGAMLFCGQALQATEPTSMGNLTETSVKISEMDMDKDFGKAGTVLDTFYTGKGSKEIMGDTAVYFSESQESRPATATDICNAQPSRLVLSGKVPPLKSADNDGTKPAEGSSLPLTASALVLGAAFLGLAANKKEGYFSNYGEDLDTVTDFVIDLITTDPKPNPPPPNENYNVHPSGAAPTCNGPNYCTLP